MKRILATALAGIICTGALCAKSQLDSLAARIADANPATAARLSELTSADLSLQAAGMLPGPELEGEHLWGPGGDNRWGMGISQSFDWPGVYAAQRRERKAARSAFALLAKSERAEAELTARLALIDLIAARKEAAVIADIYANVSEMEQLTRRALDHGQATILDVRKLQIESLDIALRLEQAEQARAEALNALRAMGWTDTVAGTLDYPEEAADYSEAERQWAESPALAAARSSAQAASERATAAARSMLPGFSLGYRHQFEGGNHFNGISAAIALPAWGSGKARRAAKAEAEAARMQADALAAQTHSDFDSARRRLQGLAERRRAYSEALDASDYPLLLKKSLTGGQISTLTYIQELNFFMEAGIARLRNERDYQSALAFLYKYR
ncbi:MAG: TolC family protein [Muribaculaceae bacterium]|nr:TolC family protein [Muribaculaceae bacterium]